MLSAIIYTVGSFLMMLTGLFIGFRHAHERMSRGEAPNFLMCTIPIIFAGIGAAMFLQMLDVWL